MQETRVSVTDLKFQRGDAPTAEGRGAPTFYLTNFFPENCMKMRRLWFRGEGARPLRPLRSANLIFSLHSVVQIRPLAILEYDNKNKK